MKDILMAKSKKKKKPKQRKSKREPPHNIHLRELDSRPYYPEERLTAKFQTFFEKEIWPLLKPLHRGYKLEEKKEVATQCIHSLIGTGLTSTTVADSRDFHKDQLRIEVWDVLVEKGFCKMGLGSESSKKVTRYYASSYLLRLRENWELKLLVDLNLERNTELAEPSRHALVVLYSGKKDLMTGKTLPDEERHQPLSIRKRIKATPHVYRRYRKDGRITVDPGALEVRLNFFRKIEDTIEAINRENLKHTWIAKSIHTTELGNIITFPVNVCLRQIHSGGLFRCMRLYSWGDFSGQSLSKEQRKTILIDSEPATEVDSSCNQIRLAYHFCRIDKRGDIYYPEKIFPRYYSFENVSDASLDIVRGFVKICTIIMLNTSNKITAIKAIGKKLRNDENTRFLTNLIFKVEQTTVSGILERIVKTHPKKVANCFFTEDKDEWGRNFGTQLMEAESYIMFQVLEKLVIQEKIPALAIHDALVVKEEDVERAEEVFTETYHKIVHFKPVLKRKF